MTRGKYILISLILLLIQLVSSMSVSLSTYFFIAPVCFVIMGLERGASPMKCMLIAFLTGLCVDFFTAGVPGLWSGALTASVLPRFLIVRRRSWDDESGLYDMPSSIDMGFGVYLVYALFVNAVFYTCYVLLERIGYVFTLTDLIRVVLSTAINSLLMLLLCMFIQEKRKY